MAALPVSSINEKLFQKWVRADQPVDLLQKFPQFAKFLDSSMILSQMKITRDRVQERDGEPVLLVDGALVKESILHNRFEVIESKFYDQKFVVEKGTRRIFTYLDNGKGLQPHHPYQTTNTPISTLDPASYERTWNKAAEFVRSDEIELTPAERAERNQERPFILQLVTSKIHHGQTNYHQFLRNPKHTYMRMIVGRDNPDLNTKKGEVYEVGYGWKKVPTLPFIATTGRFRSPDVWEYLSPCERIVTNIPLSQEEAHRFYEFTLKYHLDGIHLGIEPGFHLIRQNCTVYFREACKSAGINVPTEISLTGILIRIAPNWIQKLGRQLSSWKDSTLFLASRITPNFISTLYIKTIQTIQKLFAAAAAVLSTPFTTLLGTGIGKGGAAFRQPGEQPARVAPSFWSNLFTFSKFNQPGVVQEWQLQQPSTVVYKNHPVKLAIVPPL